MEMATARKIWTLRELHSLPDDGNKYELVRGELFVTPPPNEDHEVIAARLTRLLDPFVVAQGLGYVFRARAVMRFEGSEVEPDLMVRAAKAPGARDWTDAPTPLLIVEILSPSTRRRDHEQKRQLYLDAGVPEYWIIDPLERTVTVLKPGETDRVERTQLDWRPRPDGATLTIQVSELWTTG